MAALTASDFLLLELVKSGTCEDPDHPERMMRVETRRDTDSGLIFTMRFPMMASKERLDAFLPAPA